MQDTIINTVKLHYGINPHSISPLGGGFYGRTFLVEIDISPYILVAKLYLFPDIASKEFEQIQKLSKYATLKMPQLYGLYKVSDTGYSYDLIFMEYIEGISAADVNALQLENKHYISEDIINNLISYHQATNSQGFGDLSSKYYYTTWQEYYYPIAKNVVTKAKNLFNQGQLSSQIISIFERSLDQFNNIFYLPITKSSLIHGDYNTWNIMLNKNCNQAYAVIDPFNCCWADNEFDLYQLDNANGREYELLKRYSEKIPLSKNFNEKRCFYELYSEVSHYHDAQVPANLKAIELLANKVAEFID